MFGLYVFSSILHSFTQFGLICGFCLPIRTKQSTNIETLIQLKHSARNGNTTLLQLTNMHFFFLNIVFARDVHGA